MTVQPDPLTSAIQLAGMILGTIAGFGIFALVWKAAWMIRDIKAMAESTNASLLQFSKRILDLVEDHEVRLRHVETEVVKNGVHYEGPERRHPHKESP